MQALIAIDTWVLHDLYEEEITTVELVGADNIAVALQLKNEEKVFLTHKNKQDLRTHMEGTVAKVLSIDLGYKKTFSRRTQFDENDVLTARIQFGFIDHGRVREVKDKGMGKGIEVTVEIHPTIG